MNFGQPSSENTSKLAASCVLLVDDEKLVRDATRLMLEFRYAKVLLADSGGSAIEVLDSVEVLPNLMILDLSMPEMSGQETLVHIREKFPTIPIIVSSGHQVEFSDFDSLPVEGPDEIIQKPYTLKNFLAVVDAVLNR